MRCSVNNKHLVTWGRPRGDRREQNITEMMSVVNEDSEILV